MLTSFLQRENAYLIREVGRGLEVVLRKQGDIGATVTVRVVGAVAAGALQLVADAAINTKLGRMPRGTTFTIAGVAGAYTLTAAAESTTAAPAQIVLHFTPALPIGGAADNAVITWTKTYAEWTYSAMRPKTNETTKKATEKGIRIYQLAYKSGNEPPEVGVNDVLDGLPVVEVEPIGPGGVGTEMRWRVTTGAKP